MSAAICTTVSMVTVLLQKWIPKDVHKLGPEWDRERGVLLITLAALLLKGDSRTMTVLLGSELREIMDNVYGV
uniref:Uncharacterized protein n=1 Tax=Parascaris equorum TaxID=6256 RepID=A0A914RMH4_PAREQ